MEANLSVFKYPEAHSNGRNVPGFPFGSPVEIHEKSPKHHFCELQFNRTQLLSLAKCSESQKN